MDLQPHPYRWHLSETNCDNYVGNYRFHAIVFIVLLVIHQCLEKLGAKSVRAAVNRIADSMLTCVE